ncbi:MAG: hypothetical protein HYR55_09340 [Acidobacteria bacterium]|nr:hypothetical protein [Acidobacteriota bacterium]MBI3656687.1 hypothetical protein [Acidobacteriota bacterium]
MEKKINSEGERSEGIHIASEKFGPATPTGWRCQKCSQTRSSSDLLRGDGLCERCRCE